MQEQVAATPTDAAQPSLDDKIAAKFGMDEPEAPIEQEQTPPPESEAPDEEPAIEVDEEAPPEAEEQPTDFVEIKHNGQIKKVSKEEAINLAQKGFDYESRMAENKAVRAHIESIAKGVQAQQALAPQVVDAIAEAKAYERELYKFSQTDWVKESQDDPIGAFQKRQQYDTLVNGYNAALQHANAIASHQQQVSVQVNQEVAALEARELTEKVPAWRDTKVYEKEWAEITKLFTGTLKPSTVDALIPAIYADHGISLLLRDALKYREAVAAMKSRTTKAVPAMPKPGTPQQRLSKSEAIREGIKQVHQAKDPARRKALLDEVIAQKFGVG